MIQPPHPPDAAVLAAAVPWLRDSGQVTTPSPAVADALRAAGILTQVAALESLTDRSVTTVALLDDELSHAGEHAEGLVSRLVDVLVPDGRIVASAVGAVAGTTISAARRYRSDELHRALGHHGVDLDLLCAPGAGATLRRAAEITYDPDVDRLPGLLDAAPRLVAAGRTAGSSAGRSRAFFGTLPQKVVAAAVLCQDDEGRLLIVHDTFKQHWTIPGGVVDAHEDPQAAAVREAWEEAGVRVEASEIAGLFSASWPDRLVLVYRAQPAGPVQPGHQPLHAHEIGAVEWVPIQDALQRLAPHVAEQVRFCLEHPGGSLRQGWE